MVQQIPWIERSFSFDFPLGLFPVILERLRGTTFRLEVMLRGINDEILSARPEGKWSVKEQVGHLCDLEDLWSSRVDDFLSGKEVLTPADMSNTRTHSARHGDESLVLLLKRFGAARSALVEKVAFADVETASLTALHPRLQQPMRLVDSLYFAAEHDDHHLARIRQLISMKNFA
ncbi:MAG TPA: DinB family protein [Chitinophagaceae bacterium]|nr:DinB family protein [Chitinophagaceae bacterium]